MLPVNTRVNENNEAIITSFRADDSGWYLYEIKKKCKYKVLLPETERDTPVYCPNAAAVASVLKEFGREFTVNNVYDNINPNRGSRRHEHKLKGAQIVKL